MNMCFWEKSFVFMLASTLCSSIVFAGAAEEKTFDLSVRVPKLKPGFAVTGGPLLLQPTSSTQGYAILTSPFPIPTPNWQVQEVNSDYQFGFYAGGSYTFERPGADVRLGWIRLESNDNSAATADASQFVGPFYEIGPNAGSLRQTQGELKRDFNFVTLDFGQTIDVGEAFRLRFFGGLDYLYIKQNLLASFSSPTDLFSTTSDTESLFSGVGPRLGLLGEYGLRKHLAITGMFATSISIGTMSPEMTFVSSSTDLQAIGISENHQAITVQKTTQVVPGVEGRMGLAYLFNPTVSSELVVELGYTAAAFIDVISSEQPSTAVAALQTGTTAVATLSGSQTNFGINGPYLIARFRSLA